MQIDQVSALRMQLETCDELMEALVKQRDAALFKVGILRKALERVLDGCFCDDVGQLPECARCVEVRKALKSVAE